jgi:hypothetical protein
MATGWNRAVRGARPQGLVEGGGDEEEMADVDEEEETAEEARNITMAEIDAEAATMTAIHTATVIETGALATNKLSNTAQLSKVIQVDHCGPGDRSRMQAGRSLLSRATERVCPVRRLN